MPRKPLRSQLNQIRAWVREGRTDAWIAHQLDIPASELREFRRRHELAPDEGEELDLRDEIEAEIEAAMEERGDDEDEEEAAEPEAAETEAAEEAAPAARPAGDGGEGEPEGGGRRRRRRRRGRGGRGTGALQATFDHGDADGFGLWLDPAVQDDPVYSENWAGHRKVEVTIEADQIVIRRV